MFVLRSQEQIESTLRAELEEAEKQLCNTSPDHLPEARERFKQALHRFTVFVIDGEVPKDLRSDAER